MSPTLGQVRSTAVLRRPLPLYQHAPACAASRQQPNSIRPHCTPLLGMCSCALAWHVHTFDICESSDLTELADFLLFSLVSQVIDGASEAVFNQAFMLERLDDFR